MDVAVLRVVKTTFTYVVLCLSLLGGMSVFYESIFFADNKQEFKYLIIMNVLQQKFLTVDI